MLFFLALIAFVFISALCKAAFHLGVRSGEKRALDRGRTP